MSGRRHPVGGGIETADDRRGIVLPGKKASESTVFGFRGGYGIGVAGSPPKESAQEGNGRETPLGDYTPRRRATHI